MTQGQPITGHTPTVDEYLASVIAIANECRKSLTPATLARVDIGLLTERARAADNAVERVLSTLVDSFTE